MHDNIQWSIGASALRVRCASADRPRDPWLAQWSDDDPDAGVVDGQWQFSLAFERWRALGEPPPPDAEPELVDLFRAQHSALGRLQGLHVQHVAIATIGHIGAPAVSFVCVVDDHPLSDSDAPTPFASDAMGERHALSPCAFVAYERLCEWNAKGQATRQEQIYFIGRLREHLERASELLGGAAMPFTHALDPHLQSFTVRRLERVALGWRPQANERVLDLQLDELGADGARKPLDVRKLDPAHPMIAESPTSHVLLDDDTAAVARVVKTQKNKLRAQVERHFASPASVLPEGISLDRIDLSAYSPRVVGFAPIVRAERFIDIRSSGVAWYERDTGGPFLVLEIAQAGGGTTKLSLATPAAAAEAAAQLRRALANPPPEVVAIGDQRVAPTEALAERIEQDLAAWSRVVGGEAAGGDAGGGEAVAGRLASAVGPSARLAAVISDDAPAAAGEDEGEGEDVDVPWAVLAPLLADGVALKEHQRAGVAWLWRLAARGEAGALLADDMGLGKTLQIAAFLAMQRATSARNAPSLIVCPVILLENWRAELGKFFGPDVFAPLLVLYGETLRAHKRDGGLDAERLRGASYVLTNYETLQAHQQTLLAIDWDIVVLDEAHAIKNPDTYRARAARGLKRRFGICSTGTPVENRLGDLWALYDFLSPGRPFSTRRAFETDYEEDDAGVARVREVLAYPSPASSVLRRTKDEVLDLPPKTAQLHRIAMTPTQVAHERAIVARGGGVLKILQGLQALYQHPQLLMPPQDRGVLRVDDALAQSPKLALCVDILRQVRAAGEKALVFTLWTEMQDLLVEVLRRELDLPRVRVINGDPKRRGQAHRAIDEFSATPGFDVLVLSPLAAGTGLTITAANHVIHYGRWWNPAKEDQATDRAYRIGQTRPVQVHYPLLTHPGDAARGFDVKLHALVERKRAMARAFLAPLPEDVSLTELAALEET